MPLQENGWGPAVTIRYDTDKKTVIPSLDELVAAAHRHLQRQGVTLYGQTFNIYDERDVAAEWLANEVREVMREAIWPKR